MEAVENLWKTQVFFPQGIYTKLTLPPKSHSFPQIVQEFSTEIHKFSTNNLGLIFLYTHFNLSNV